MAEFQCLLHPLPGTHEQFIERLCEASDQINKANNENHKVLGELKAEVKEVVIGPSHIGILLEDGRAFRVSFFIHFDQMDLRYNDSNKSSPFNNSDGPKSDVNISTRLISRSRSKLLKSSTRSSGQVSRNSGAGIAGSSNRPLVAVPVPFVPDDLISQAEAVLQGKSKNLIIRELQRTNLDVNLAVNNLLSHDDDEAEDVQSGEHYAPDDLISLLDNGFQTDSSNVIVDPADGLFSEEIFSNYSSIRNLLFNRIRSDRNQSNVTSNTKKNNSSASLENAISSGNNCCASSLSGNADSFSRWRERQCYGQRRLFPNDGTVFEKEDDAKPTTCTTNASPLWISEELQAWPEKDVPIRFQKIVSLFSEFVGLSDQGYLHQWRWSENETYKADIPNIFHPKTLQLNINEKITKISSSSTRCTVATISNQIASWMDEHLGKHAMKFSHALQPLSDSFTDIIVSLHVSALFTVALTASQNLFWWGVLPFEQRKSLWDRFRSKTKKNIKLVHDEITVGAQVMMKKCPIYQPGSIGFTCKHGIPKIGQLIDSAWEFSGVYRFKILTHSSQDPNQLLNSKIKTQNLKESTDRQDMPPPPSPASNTCVDSNTVPKKKAKRVIQKEHLEGQKDEELWSLKDVVFVEDRNGPIGKVLKVDGDYAAIRFLSHGQNIERNGDDWQHCRLLKKEDVQIVKSLVSSKVPEYYQKTPKRLNVINSSDANFIQYLAVAVDAKGVHTISKMSRNILYNIFSLHNSKQEQSSVLPTDYNVFLGNSQDNIAIQLSDDFNDNCTIMIIDGNRTLYPFARDCNGDLKDPQWLSFPPIRTVAMSTVSLPIHGVDLKSKVCMVIMFLEKQYLMPSILRCDLNSIVTLLGNLDNESLLTLVVNEKCDGGRNILHASVVLCSPTSKINNDEPTSQAFKKDLPCSSTDSVTSGESFTTNLRDMMNRLVNTHSDLRNHITSSTKGEKQGPFELMQSEDESSNPQSSSKQSYFNKPNTSIFISDPVERREQSILILQQICCNSFLRPKLHSLLSLQDATGLTPFMLSVTSRAYEAGLILFDTILSLSEDNPSIKESMIFPAGSSVDKSPLYVICYNDTCSFTWTGADHINQNIFECRTCGLTGSLCCCTECARVCHKGHDCKLKRTSPTAYCDCWEKCKCKALIAGNQNKRFSLLCKLISNTNLVTKLNLKGESILLFLIQTIGRQSVEQKQYRACNRSRSYSANNKKTQSKDNDPEMPDHDLEPPRFAKKALQRFLEDWQSVKVMIMTGTEERLQNEKIKNCGDMDSCSLKYLKSQSGSTLLDKFTHNLFVKCSQEHLDVLISTLVRETSETSNIVEKSIARRFIRSVARVYIIFNLERSPTENRKNAQSKHIQNCIAVFQSLPILAIEELCEIAVALIGPVRLGVVRPTAPFAMSSSNLDNSEDIFSIDPFVFATRTASQTRSLPVDATNASSGNIDLGLNFGVLRPENNNFEANMGPSGIVTSRQGSKCRLQPYSENMRSDDGGENESENEFNFNDAETESDSDDEQSSQSAQGIVPSATIVESETEESGDSSTHEDEGSDDGDTDENSEDSYSLNDSQLERNSADASKGTPSASSHWAIRNSEPAASSSMRLPTSSGLIFIDPLALRRTAITSSASSNLQEPHSMSTTASSLARAFGIIMRQITDLLSSIEFNNVNIEKNMKVTLAEYIEVQMFLEIRLKETWNWVFSVLDATEAQLKFGACLTNPLDQSQAFRNINSNPQTINDEHFGINFLGSTSSRREFFTYCLSLMRAHSSEHRDSLPVLDITALRHIAYALDGFIYYMKSEKCSDIKTEEYQVLETDTNRKTKKSSSNDEYTTVINNPDKKQNFFRRSESTLSLGCCAPDPFSLTLEMALPLADKPQLLQTNARKEDLFLNFPLPITLSNNDPESAQELSMLETPPLRVEFLHQNKPKHILEDVVHTNKSKPVSPHKSFSRESSTSFKAENSFYSVPTDKKGCIDQQRKRNISRSSTVSSKFNQIEASSQNSVLRPNNLESKTSLGIDNRSEHAQNINQHFPKSKGNQNTRIKKLTQCLGAESTTPATWNVLLGRWKHSLDLFGRVFIEDVGLEYGSILSETRGFTAKETRFRRQMEKLRNGQQRDLVFSKLERSREGLIVQTFRELNTQFGAQYRRNCPPLTFNRVKVTFKEEPGEGSGVARSFYTSIAEALLAKEKLPDLETAQIESPQKYGLSLPSSLKNRSAISRDTTLQRKGPGKIVWRSNKEKKGCNHSATALLNTIQDSSNSETSNNGQLSIPLQQLGDCMYPKISAITNAHTSKNSGTFLDTPPSRLSSEDTLKQKINEALDIILDKQNATEDTRNNVTSVDRCADNDPLFYSPGKRGFYSPRQGRASFERINAFRNIGRLIGICLLQNELFPLYLQRHVLKYILGKQIRFHDLAFFDPTVYESLRQLIQASQSDGADVLDGLDLFFVIDLIKEEGGETVELVPNGRTVQVTTANILDYVRLYAEERMVISQVKALEALKYGVFDVIPECSLESLTSEDLRLLLNGTGDINISILISYTTFNDESSESNDKLLRFKKWFWYTVEKMNTTERQDLLYFWTGSPALPASEEGFQPLPSITIRPIDDHHLPTANTCISRLYIPLYSSKTILRSKILLAIRSKNFGFV